MGLHSNYPVPWGEALPLVKRLLVLTGSVQDVVEKDGKAALEEAFKWFWD